MPQLAIQLINNGLNGTFKLGNQPLSTPVMSTFTSIYMAINGVYTFAYYKARGTKFADMPATAVAPTTKIANLLPKTWKMNDDGEDVFQLEKSAMPLGFVQEEEAAATGLEISIRNETEVKKEEVEELIVVEGTQTESLSCLGLLCISSNIDTKKEKKSSNGPLSPEAAVSNGDEDDVHFSWRDVLLKFFTFGLCGGSTVVDDEDVQPVQVQLIIESICIILHGILCMTDIVDDPNQQEFYQSKIITKLKTVHDVKWELTCKIDATEANDKVADITRLMKHDYRVEFMRYWLILREKVIEEEVMDELKDTKNGIKNSTRRKGLSRDPMLQMKQLFGYMFNVIKLQHSLNRSVFNEACDLEKDYLVDVEAFESYFDEQNGLKLNDAEADSFVHFISENMQYKARWEYLGYWKELFPVLIKVGQIDDSIALNDPDILIKQLCRQLLLLFFDFSHCTSTNKARAVLRQYRIKENKSSSLEKSILDEKNDVAANAKMNSIMCLYDQATRERQSALWRQLKVLLMQRQEVKVTYNDINTYNSYQELRTDMVNEMQNMLQMHVTSHKNKQELDRAIVEVGVNMNDSFSLSSMLLKADGPNLEAHPIVWTLAAPMMNSYSSQFIKLWLDVCNVKEGFEIDRTAKSNVCKKLLNVLLNKQFGKIELMEKILDTEKLNFVDDEDVQQCFNGPEGTLKSYLLSKSENSVRPTAYKIACKIACKLNKENCM